MKNNKRPKHGYLLRQINWKWFCVNFLLDFFFLLFLLRERDRDSHIVHFCLVIRLLYFCHHHIIYIIRSWLEECIHNIILFSKQFLISRCHIHAHTLIYIHQKMHAYDLQIDKHLHKQFEIPLHLMWSFHTFQWIFLNVFWYYILYFENLTLLWACVS